MKDDPFAISRFIVAQAPIYDEVISELAAGQKTGHWMWYIFPQHVALGSSPLSKRFGLTGVSEAKAFLSHPLLGPRLQECVGLVLASNAPSLGRIFGPDDMKFRSSVTLFAVACETQESCFHVGIDRWCAGLMDQKTIDLVSPPSPTEPVHNECSLLNR